MIRYCLLLVTLAGVFLDTNAQEQFKVDSGMVIAPDDFFGLLVPPEEVEGRTKLFTDWQQGEVFLSQGKFVSDITFNYDVLNHILLVLVDEKEFSLNPIAVDSILIANSSKDLINPIILDGIDVDLLLLRVYNGQHISLFRNTLAKVVDRDINTAAIEKFEYSKNDDVQIDQEQVYFLLNKVTKEITEFQGKKKELKNWENGDQVMSFVKDQNLVLKNEADLIKVVQYYEQLSFGVE